MNKIKAKGLCRAIPLLAIAFTPGLVMAQGEPTCKDFDTHPVANHGQHVIGDYVVPPAGTGHDDLGWPPAGEVGGNGGAILPGGPAAGGHFGVEGLAPGASFCNPQAHPGGFDTPPVP